MKIEITNNSAQNVNAKIFREISDLVSQEEKLLPECSLSLLITDDNTSKDLNQKYLGRDDYTDVLSFSASIPGSSFLGDILIDIRIAETQRGARSLEDELRILFLHGLLHLLGYDHLAEKDRKIMRTKEKKYLRSLKECVSKWK